jgi:hypothetical protein
MWLEETTSSRSRPALSVVAVLRLGKGDMKPLVKRHRNSRVDDRFLHPA